MNDEPCKVCGNTDMNLIDGFYYCVECGTQDANVIETMVGNTVLKDGTIAIKQKTKITKFNRIVQKVSPEWHKWQAYNYLLSSMTKEVMDLGAGPNFKMRVMWIWITYVKIFQKKQELGLSGDDVEPLENTNSINRVLIRKKYNGVLQKYNIAKMSANLLVTIIYVALNFDRNDILLSDLIRFIREGRVSFRNCLKYLPEEIDASLIEGFNHFVTSVNPNVDYMNTQAMTVLKTLKLGCPIVPDLKKIVARYTKELSLPDGFKDLVFSLMNFVPCDYLNINELIMKEITSVPFYECRVMAYILVALKMCFGLDDEYENKLSDAVDHLNNENCHMKCYKLGVFSTTSDRLFSFREWMKFLQLRKLILSRCYVPLSLLYQMEVDDYVYMEQGHETLLSSYKKEPSLFDNIIMSLLEKLQTEPRKEVIPKNAFRPTLTPLTDYTEVVLKNYHDPEIKLLLSEDFSQYSLKYAYENLDLRVSDESENIIVGVDESSKCIKTEIQSNLSSIFDVKRDYSMVYVRNCENKNWLKTKPPSKKHIKTFKKESANLDDDVDSSEIFPSDSETGTIADETVGLEDVCYDKKLEFIEEDKSANIFDDDFQNLEEYEPKTQPDSPKIKDEPVDEEDFEHNYQNETELLSTNSENPDMNSNAPASLPDEHGFEYFFDPETFDREDAIKHLVLMTCKKYSIPIPKEYRTVENIVPRKRKAKIVNNENDNGDVIPEKKSKKRAKRGTAQARVNVLLSAYYDSLRHDVFSSVSHCIRDLVAGLDKSQEILNIDEQLGADLGYSENHQNESCQDNNSINGDDTNNVHDPSLLEIENQTLDDSTIAEEEIAHKRDPKFDDKIYDTKQLYLKVDDVNIDDIFDICDDPEVDKILSKKIDELKAVRQDSNKTNVKDDKKEENFSDWYDDVPLSELKEQILDRSKAREDAFKNLEYLVADRKKITMNNYWVRREKNMFRVQNRVDSFTNELKERFPKSFSFLLIECAAILDCTPFVLYKNMLRIEDCLICD